MPDACLEALKTVERMLAAQPSNELESVINGSIERIKQLEGGVQYEGQIDGSRSIYTATRSTDGGTERVVCTRDGVLAGDGIIRMIFQKATHMRDAAGK